MHTHVESRCLYQSIWTTHASSPWQPCGAGGRGCERDHGRSACCVVLLPFATISIRSETGTVLRRQPRLSQLPSPTPAALRWQDATSDSDWATSSRNSTSRPPVLTDSAAKLAAPASRSLFARTSSLALAWTPRAKLLTSQWAPALFQEEVDRRASSSPGEGGGDAWQDSSVPSHLRAQGRSLGPALLSLGWIRKAGSLSSLLLTGCQLDPWLLALGFFSASRMHPRAGFRGEEDGDLLLCRRSAL